MRFRWSIAKPVPEEAARLATEFAITPLLAQCLVNRGYEETSETAKYLGPRLKHLADPFLLPQMDRAVERLLRAHAQKETLVVFGDYDVDGVTATALLHEFLTHFGWNVSYYLPHRLEEGYGLSSDAVENCLAKAPSNLILAVDCGSSSREVIRSLAGCSIEVIVLDHHQVSEPRPVPCALVNPHLGSHGRELCSVGLAFKMAHALLKKMRLLNWPGSQGYDLRQQLDLVALGTIADVVPLRGENRILVKTGLERLQSTHRSGIVALKAICGLTGPVAVGSVGFQLAPRLNAAGRLESALDALNLLLARDATVARNLAQGLHDQNAQRQALERRILEEARAAVRSRFDPTRDFAIVEGAPGWHVGVVGIVASRILQEFYRPTFIIGGDSPDTWRGSGRSIEGFDLAAGIRSCSDLLLRAGGHAMAAGVTLSPANVDDFRARLNELVRTSVPPESLTPRLDLDADVALGELTPQFAMELERLEPIGQENRPVQLLARNLTARTPPRRLGQDSAHAKFVVTDGQKQLEALWWNCPPDLKLPTRFDLAFEPQWAEYNGTCSIQLRVLDIG